MRKILFIICINILLFGGIFLTADYLYAKNEFTQYWKSTEKLNTVSSQTPAPPRFHYSLKITPFDDIWKWGFISPYRINTDKTYKKPSVLVFGCSFVQSTIRENFTFLISHKTHRMVYNRGFQGLGVANMYSQVSNPDFYKFLHPDFPPEYAVYVFITDHIYRLYSDKYALKEQIYINDNIFPESKFKTFLYRQLARSFTGRRFLERYFYSNQLKKEFNDKNFDIMKLYFEKSKEELEKRFPNIKFVIIKYPSKQIGNKDHEEIYNSTRWSELEKEGFKVIDLKTYVKADLTSFDYLFKDAHPNQKAWEVITDKFARDINRGLI